MSTNYNLIGPEYKTVSIIQNVDGKLIPLVTIYESGEIKCEPGYGIKVEFK